MEKKNRFAQVLYGKVIFIYETNLTKDQLSTVFSPDTYWIDVTDVECEVDYVVSFNEKVGLVFTAPTNNIEDYSLDEYKLRKIEAMKTIRDAKDEEPIELEDGRVYDFDERAREKINLAKFHLENHNEVDSIAWILADNNIADTTLKDFNAIVDAAVARSSLTHYQYAQLRAYIYSLKTKEDVDKVEWNILQGAMI